MVQIYTWAYQDWKTITKETLATVVGLPDGITADDYKAITGEAYVAPTTQAPVTETPESSATSEAQVSATVDNNSVQ
ncbi:XkdX family protein [Lactiplantibacillus plantarum]|uniref:XkdX family protein n=1 Tax=Lactiplantibacillus plantarum TaxID=1590 RepID=UPI00234ABB34|nr:XkdX family protein [Lactiplantibacillus plantarum]WCL69478.1 XkdX family protein [Lactiplantibacillus plantarum]